MSTVLDQARDIRDGEGFDVDTLLAHLRQAYEPKLASLSVQQFPGGHSNLTYLLSATLRDGSQCQWVLRRPPRGSNVASAHDMSREWKVLSGLWPHFAAIPQPLHYCDDVGVIGASFYLSHRVSGLIPRKKLPDGFHIDADDAGRMCSALIAKLVQLHAVSPQQVGLASLGKGHGYTRRQVTGWSRRFAAARTDDVPDLEALAQWLDARCPDDQGATLLHNDYKFDNVIYDPSDLSSVKAILDWEMATVGCPLMDLGMTLAYWVQGDDPPQLHAMRLVPTHLAGMWTRRQVADRYLEQTQRGDVDLVFYYVFGLFKLMGIIQQIYRRFVDGKTTDPRFQAFGAGVHILAQQAQRSIDADALP